MATATHRLWNTVIPQNWIQDFVIYQFVVWYYMKSGLTQK